MPRTLLDLAGTLDRHRLERAIDQAEVLRLRDRLSLGDVAERYPRTRGIGVVRSILATECRAAAITRSDLELLFLPFLERAGLPRPEINANVFADGRWFEVDCVWRAERLAAELDGRATHLTRAAFETDRARDRALLVAGWRAVRITWRQLEEDPPALARDLRTLLESPWPGAAV